MGELTTQGNEQDNFLNAPEYVPPEAEETDRRIDPETTLALTSLSGLEPFGTGFAIEVEPISNDAGTGGATEPKGGGKYDDYKTQDE